MCFSTYHSDRVCRADLLPWQKDVVRNVDKLQRHHHNGHGAMYDRRKRLLGILEVTRDETSLLTLTHASKPQKRAKQLGY